MIDQIKRFKYAQPFEPFEIELSSGSVWRIKVPDFVIVDEFGQGRIAVLNDDHTFSTVSGLHVVLLIRVISRPFAVDFLFAFAVMPADARRRKPFLAVRP
jgi:hypothetical protein